MTFVCEAIKTTCRTYDFETLWGLLICKGKISGRAGLNKHSPTCVDGSWGYAMAC